MKFAVVVVLLAVALGIEASAVAWGPWGHGVYARAWAPTAAWGPAGVWGGPTGTWDGRSWNSAWDNGAWDDGQWRGDWNDGAWHGNAWAGHAAVVAPAVKSWGHEGNYVAKTRGAVHVAPLAGHANSASSINLQPAPGTV